MLHSSQVRGNVMKKTLVIARNAFKRYSDAIRTESSKAIAFAGEDAFNYIHASFTRSGIKRYVAGELGRVLADIESVQEVYLQVGNTPDFSQQKEMQLAYYLSQKDGKAVTVYTVDDEFHVKPVMEPWAKGLGVTLRVLKDTQHNLYGGEIFDELFKE